MTPGRARTTITLLALALAAAAGLPAAAHAAPVDLLTAANLRIDGANANDFSGLSVSGAGDVNGDGRADVIIGAYRADNNGRTDSGSSYIVSAPARRSLPAVVRASTGWMLRDTLSSGAPTTSFTYGARPLVALMGDWDGHGTKTAATFEGGVFKQRNTNSAGAADITFTFGDRRGFPVAADFNGDSTDDVAVYRNGLWQIRLSSGTVLESAQQRQRRPR